MTGLTRRATILMRENLVGDGGRAAENCAINYRGRDHAETVTLLGTRAILEAMTISDETLSVTHYPGLCIMQQHQLLPANILIPIPENVSVTFNCSVIYNVITAWQNDLERCW